MSLIKLQNSIKKKAFPFYTEVSKTAPQYAIWNVEAAFKKMWREKTGYPKFKKKGVKDSFVAVENSVAFKQQNKKIWIPRIGWEKCHENLRFEGKVNNVVVKRIADKYFAVVNLISNETPAVSENQAAVGVDLGIKSLLVLSDGKTFENPKALKIKPEITKKTSAWIEPKEKRQQQQA
jgi:putative transposase